jgi:hypothetical protein
VAARPEEPLASKLLQASKDAYLEHGTTDQINNEEWSSHWVLCPNKIVT